jgi:hypothetical protein
MRDPYVITEGVSKDFGNRKGMSHLRVNPADTFF